MPIITRETDYALRALARLGEEGGFASVSTLSEEVDVPEGFLRKIMQTLHRAGIVESRQGPFGGYRLSADPEEITMLDVLETVQGPVAINECFRSPEVCNRTPDCPLRNHLAKLQAGLAEEMDGIALSDLLKRIPTEKTARG